MNYDYEQTEFSRAILSGLFAGIFATFANLIFNFFFRYITQYNPSAIINVSSIIIGSVLVVTITGIIFYFFNHYIKGGNVVFSIFFFALVVLAVYYSMHAPRSNDALVTKQFDELLAGIVIVTGAFIVFYIPYLFKHEKVYS